MNSEFKSGACPQYEALLEDFLAGELGGEPASRLSAHLKSCAGCRAALEFASGSVPLLRVAEPAPDPGPGFARMLLARIRSERDRASVEKGIWQPMIPFAMRFAAVAALLFVGLITYDVAFRHQVDNNPSLTRATESRDLFPDTGMAPENRDEVLMMVAEQKHGKH